MPAKKTETQTPAPKKTAAAARQRVKDLSAALQDLRTEADQLLARREELMQQRENVSERPRPANEAAEVVGEAIDAVTTSWVKHYGGHEFESAFRHSHDADRAGAALRRMVGRENAGDFLVGILGEELKQAMARRLAEIAPDEPPYRVLNLTLS